MSDPDHPSVAVLDKTLAPTKGISNDNFQTGAGMSEENKKLFDYPEMHHFNVATTTIGSGIIKDKKPLPEKSNQPPPKKKKIKSNIVTY